MKTNNVTALVLLSVMVFTLTGIPAAAAVQSRVPELFIKHIVYLELWICGSTGPGLLMDFVVYEKL